MKGNLAIRVIRKSSDKRSLWLWSALGASSHGALRSGWLHNTGGPFLCIKCQREFHLGKCKKVARDCDSDCKVSSTQRGRNKCEIISGETKPHGTVITSANSGESMPQHNEERLPLLSRRLPGELLPPKHISVIFAVACIVDQFGVNPIVVLPRGIILCGWVGYPMALFVFSLTIYTAMLLGKCWLIAEHLDSAMALKTRYAYSALTEMAWGRPVGKVINILINVSVFSSNIPALLIASQNLQFFDAKISNYAFNFSYCYWLVILGVALCPLTWLGSPKDTKWISVFSAFSVITCALLTWVCIISDDTKDTIYGQIPSPNWQGVSVAFGILTFQFGCHPAILTIQTDMHNKSKLSTSILLSFCVTGGLSLITIWMSSVLYGSGTHANLTQGLPVNLVLYFDILVVTLQLFLSTIVGQCTLFQDVEDKLGVPRELCWQRCLVRSSIVMLLIFFAEVLPRFDLVMGVIGGALTGPITLIFPPLLYLRFRALLSEQNLKTKLQVVTEKDSQIFRKRDLLARIHSPVEEQRIFRRRSTATRAKLFLEKLAGFFSPEMSLNGGKVTTSESATAFFIVGIGVVQTIVATYYSTRAAIRSTRFLPPCMVDVEAASKIINA